jgi:hypothetical protein
MSWLTSNIHWLALGPAVWWAGAIGLPAGAALGLLCRALVDQRRHGRLRLYASLWEWARQREEADGGKEHARRIQRYYRQMRRCRRPQFHLSWAAVMASLALMALVLPVAGGLALPLDPAQWIGVLGLGMAGAVLCLAWPPGGALAGVAGLAALAILLAAG